MMRNPTSREEITVAMLARAVYPLHGYGGIERHVFHLVTHLSDLGVEVELFVQDVPGSAPQEGYAIERLLHNPRIRLHTLRYDRTSPLLRPNSIVGRQINYPLYSWREARAAEGLVRAGRVDVVHAQGLCALGWALRRRQDAALRRTPFIANPHGMEEYKGPDWRKRLAYTPFRAQYSWAHRQADRAIATDACTAGDLPALLGVAEERVVVIPSAIDVAESLGAADQSLGRELRARFGLDAADLTLLTVSRLERNKGYHHLLDALHRLRAELPPRWRLLLVGTGNAAAALQAQSSSLGLDGHVTFVGRLDDAELHSLYEQVDLFVHPTLYEGSSLVTLEAMIHRLPVIATAAGGIPDKVFSGRNGLIIPPDDPRALANALRLALQLRERWPAWGAAGAAIVRRSFDWPVVARQTRAAYQELIGGR
jgi:glycosyltransferase involved in cell wall biosynthesis